MLLIERYINAKSIEYNESVHIRQSSKSDNDKPIQPENISI